MGRGFAAVSLWGPKSDCNIGGAMRAATCYGVSLVIITATRNVRYAADTHKTWRHIPTILSPDPFSVMPYGCIPVAVEFMEDARSLVDYTHPQRALYIFGPEDGSLGKQILGKCRDVVMVPTHLCMNLAATVNVVLYDRLAKQERMNGKVAGNLAEMKLEDSAIRL